jgi:rhomboid protease GluP
MHQTDTDLGPATDPVTLRLAMRRLPLWSSGLTFMATVTAAFAVHALAQLLPRLWQGAPLQASIIESMALAALFTAIIGLSLGKRLLVRTRPLPAIVFYETHVMLPPGSEALRPRAVPYADILSVNEGGLSPQRHFFIESRRHVFHLPQAAFVDANGPERLFLELRRRIGQLPQGTKLLEDTQVLRRSALRAMQRQSLATQTVLGLTAVIFINTALKNAFNTPLGLLRWGANVPLLVQQGELYRLVAANFLHGGYLPWPMPLLHVAMNGMAIFYLGNLIERLFGWQRFVVLYGVAGIGAMAASAYAGVAILSVGASGAVFGLLGSFAVVSWRLRMLLPLGLRQPLRWWLSMLVINALLPLLWPVVDRVAHMTGFALGALLTVAMVGRRPALPQPAGRTLTALSGALAAMTAGSLGMAVYHAATDSAQSELEFVQAAVRSPKVSPMALNNMAYTWAIEPRTTPEQLDAALGAARRAVDSYPRESTFQDTYATVLARQQHYAGAVHAERLALSAGDAEADPTFLSRLALWLQRPQDKAEEPYVAPQLLRTGACLRVDPADDSLVFEHAERLPLGSEVCALILHQDQRLAVVHMRLGGDARGTLRRASVLLSKLRAASKDGGDSEFWQVKTLLLDTGVDAAPAQTRWTVLPILPLSQDG